jgi:hypothetical protein
MPALAVLWHDQPFVKKSWKKSLAILRLIPTNIPAVQYLNTCEYLFAWQNFVVFEPCLMGLFNREVCGGD